MGHPYLTNHKQCKLLPCQYNCFQFSLMQACLAERKTVKERKICDGMQEEYPLCTWNLTRIEIAYCQCHTLFFSLAYYGHCNNNNCEGDQWLYRGMFALSSSTRLDTCGWCWILFWFICGCHEATRVKSTMKMVACVCSDTSWNVIVWWATFDYSTWAFFCIGIQRILIWIVFEFSNMWNFLDLLSTSISRNSN